MTSPHQQKLRITGPVIITGNRLADGAVVHRTVDNGWSNLLQDAAIFSDAPSVQEALRIAALDSLVAVGLYVAPVDISESDPEPGNLRETIRAKGPSFALPSDDSYELRKPASRFEPRTTTQTAG